MTTNDMIELLLGIIATVAIALAGWALVTVVRLQERLSVVETRVGESKDDGLRGAVTKLETAVERLSDVVGRVDTHLERLGQRDG